MIIYRHILKRIKFLLSLVCFIGLTACSKNALDLIYDPFLDSESIENSPFDYLTNLAIKRRCEEFGLIQWTSKDTLKTNVGFYYPGQMVTGMPYSSVKECDKFIGFDVSIYTFMTAAHNPRSVLYTENVGRTPYQGVNCTAYYGTVCSATVCYALGLDMPWATSAIDTLSFFKLAEHQDAKDVRRYDILWQKGHEIFVYDVNFNPKDSSLTGIQILESRQEGTSVRNYSFSEFKNRYESGHFRIYKFIAPELCLPYDESESLVIDGINQKTIKYNDIICPSLGDRAVYRMGEPVVINILDENFTKFVIYRNEEYFAETESIDKDLVLNHLQYGKYAVYAINASTEKKSLPAEFEVVDTNVSAKVDGMFAAVQFSSVFGKPVYVAICDKTGSPKKKMRLSEAEIINGCSTIEIPELNTPLFLKIYFRTPWGRVTNIPISLTDN